MKKRPIKISNSLEEAIKFRNKPGFRYDNTEYWKTYYIGKLINGDMSREKRYAEFLYSMFETGGISVLDVATGYGFLPLEMQKLGFSVTCSDLFEEMSQLASSYFAKHRQEFIFTKADITQLPFKDGSFKMVTAMSILEHFPLKEIEDGILPELSRVLEPDGTLFVHVPVKSWATILKKVFRKYVEHDLSDWACDDDNDVTHKVWLSVSEYASLLKRAGFEVQYYSINFLRSNEKIQIIKYISKIFQNKFSEFYTFDNKLKEYFLSNLATSVALVCNKTR